MLPGDDVFPVKRGGGLPWVVGAYAKPGHMAQAVSTTLVLAPNATAACRAGWQILRLRGHGRKWIKARRASARDLGAEVLS